MSSSAGWLPPRSRCAIPGWCSGSARRWSARCSACSSTWTPPPANTARTTSPRTSGTTAQYPDSDEYKALFDGNFADYRLHIYGLVDHPVELDLTELRALPHHEQITQHFCIQGWSGIAKWGGVSMQTIIDLVRPQPEAKWVVFYSLGEGADKGIYYDAHPIEQMSYHLTMLAYDMNDAAPVLRPRRPAAAAQRDPARLQASQMDQGHRVRRRLLRDRRRLRRLQPGPRVLRLPTIHLAADRWGANRGAEWSMPFVDMGIGIDVREAFVANIGQRALYDFTAVGEFVNTASPAAGARSSFSSVWRTGSPDRPEPAWNSS